MINKKLESLETIKRSTLYTKVERKNDSFLDLLERMKALNSPLEKEREFEPHHRSPLAKTMTDNWHNKRNSVIENWHINSRKDDRELKATNKPIAITYKDNKKDFGKDDLKKEGLKTILTQKKQNSSIEIMQYKDDTKRTTRIEDKGIVKEMIERMERQSKKETSSIRAICKKIDIGKDIEKDMIEKEKESNSLVNLVNKEARIIPRKVIVSKKKLMKD